MRHVMLVGMLSACGFQITGGSATTGDAPPPGDAAASDGAADAPADTSIDAPPDAPAWTVADCPGAYGISIAATATTSRYRYIKSGTTAKQQALDCANDGTGTHLASLDSLLEIQQLHQAANATSGWARDTITHPNDTFIYVGGVQLAAQTDVEAGWLTVAGASQPASWAQGEANDYDLTDGVEDGEEQILTLWLQRAHLADMVPRFAFGAICECDGSAPSAAFVTAWTAAVAAE